MKRKIYSLLAVSSLLLAACSSGSQSSSSSATPIPADTLTIVAGSELQPLQPILEDYAKAHNMKISFSYQGSVDTMKQLKAGNLNYDAVWSASSLWNNMGDTHHLLSESKTISTSPVVYGIRKSKAQELGLIDKKVTTADLVQLIKDKKLSFSMTSATQSNSGATAYLTTLKALSGKDVLQADDLNSASLRESISQYLSGVNRSSSSSGWLASSFINSSDDAMVNYESTIIDTNQKLVQAGKEPLYVIYPADGVGISDAPLAFIDHQDANKKKEFEEIQNYLLTSEGQAKIQQTGRRNSFNTVDNDQAKALFKTEWGLDPNRTLPAVSLPSASVIESALNLYQSNFRKPSLTYYALDSSGSMGTEGEDQLKDALSYVMNQQKASDNLLQETDQDIVNVTSFGSSIDSLGQATGPAESQKIFDNEIMQLNSGGTTPLNETLLTIMDSIAKNPQATDGSHVPMIVVFTDGADTDTEKRAAVKARYKALKAKDTSLPIFFVAVGEATSHTEYMQELADLSNGRVFTDTKNLVKSFQTIKGYN